jgi:hypothetical protein
MRGTLLTLNVRRVPLITVPTGAAGLLTVWLSVPPAKI